MTSAINSARAIANLDAEVYVHTVTLSSGTATLTFTDVDGIDGSLATEPFVFATGPTGGEAVSSKGTSQATISGDTTDDVECLIVVPK